MFAAPAHSVSSLRYVLARVAESYNPAFLFYCNEHTFVIAENLRCYVRGLDPSEPKYLGNRFAKKGKQRSEGEKVRAEDEITAVKRKREESVR